jgi:hypothetical protein
MTDNTQFNPEITTLPISECESETKQEILDEMIDGKQFNPEITTLRSPKESNKLHRGVLPVTEYKSIKPIKNKQEILDKLKNCLEENIDELSTNCELNICTQVSPDEIQCILLNNDELFTIYDGMASKKMTIKSTTKKNLIEQILEITLSYLNEIPTDTFYYLCKLKGIIN